MRFSPVVASENITEKYRRYLKTIFSIDNDVYNKQLHDLLEKDEVLSKGPYLDISDSFEKGKSPKELMEEGLLPKGFSRVNFPMERTLYKHQEIALRKVASGNNLIVSTGTGSGKTESFMIPILRHIIMQLENNKLDPGVRALLIYPMNALANDQVERLRELLAHYPEITYGSYTGQTKEKYEAALADYKELNDDAEPLPNELISREQMKETPPHILITNYAMLEYLMVRPKDGVFFSSEYSDKWKFIVLDEAHVYNGSSGIEVSMLLRRLKATLQNEEINYILTSATLGDEKSNADVASFGENLCDSKFTSKDIVRAYRITPSIGKNRRRIDINHYTEIAEMINENTPEEDICNYLRENIDTALNGDLSRMLYDMLTSDENYIEFRNETVDVKTVQRIANHLGWSLDELTDFVDVASNAEKNGDRLINARYHMFLRATESVFVTLNPSNKLFLTRKKKHVEPNGKDYKVFEMATCDACHAVYLIGNAKSGYLEQSSFQSEDELKSVFLLKDSFSDTDEEHLLANENIAAEEYEICARCGFLRKVNKLNKEHCEHGEECMIKLIKVHVKDENGLLTKCPCCENTNNSGILRMFFTGQEAVTSVIGTALFEELPAYKMEIKKRHVEDDDAFGFGTSSDECEENRITEAKQFIAFSDSRQAAAYYASYLDQTYKRILYNRLIVETLKSYEESVKEINLPSFADRLAAQFEKFNIIENNPDLDQKEAWKAILRELVDMKTGSSLSSCGIVKVSLNQDEIKPNNYLKMTKEEVCDLCNVLVTGMMADAAIYYEEPMKFSDKEFFAHGGIEGSYTLSDPDTKKYVHSFVPRFSDKTNKRAEFLSRVLKKIGKELSKEDTNRMLENIWKAILISGKYIKPQDGLYKLDSRRMVFEKPNKWYICSKCKKITPYNVKGVCPSYRCSGELKVINVEEEMRDDHYRRMYNDLDIRNLRVVEHTAQLDKETAYEYQKEFKQKEIDVLSCSTTFEMGVDVGSLETVFMRNVPPSPANYAQRAGRAGRSKKSAAFALTFCNKSSHDFSYFNNPVDMIKGRIDPPKFVVENEKIAIRHVYASALSYFWKLNKQYFKNASLMIEGTEDGPSGCEKFKEYLDSCPNNLRQFIKRFLPDSLQDKFGVSGFQWVGTLFNESEDTPGVMTKAIAEYTYEVGILEKAKEEAYAAGKSVDGYTQRIRVYKDEDILAFLSRKNVMPKYGFPVDTVEMQVVGTGEKKKSGLQLQRDLAIAISEYAPGSQIVANGKLITSRYIRKIPKMSWKMYDYIKCDCKTLNIEPHVEDTDLSHLTQCHQCHAPLEPANRKTFLVPAFGFEADGDKIRKPGLKKPVHTYRGEISYVGYRSKVETKTFDIEGSKIEVSMSRGDEMAVINESNFFVCETCGYTDLDEKNYYPNKKMRHKNAMGGVCTNNILKRYSLGYRFETDVIQIFFMNPDIVEWETAISLLYGIIRGTCSTLNIEENDISGCVQYFYNNDTKRPNYAIILYDSAPGGAGHVRRLSSAKILKDVLENTLHIMESCTCGGETKDSSCYTCLRSYRNQKYHDILSRARVIDFIKDVIELPKKKENAKLFEHADCKQTEDEWSFLDDMLWGEESKRLAEIAREKGMPVPSEENIGYELTDEEGAVTATIELAWPEKKIGFMTKNQISEKNIVEEKGWTIYTIDSKLEALV